MPALHEIILADPLSSLQSCPKILTQDNRPAPKMRDGQNFKFHSLCDHIELSDAFAVQDVTFDRKD